MQLKDTAPEEPAGLSGDELAVAREAVLAADRAFAAALAEKNRDGLAAAFQADAVYLGSQVQYGRVSVVDEFRALFEPEKKVEAEYEPMHAEVATSGDVAWSIGRGTVRFTRLGTDEVIESSGHYMTVWTPDSKGAWKAWASGTLVVHPDAELGLAREPRYGLAQAWSWKLLNAPDAEVELSWAVEKSVMASSGKMGAVLGKYRVTAKRGEDDESGGGGYVAVRVQDEQGRWKLVGEIYTPPFEQ